VVVGSWELRCGGGRDGAELLLRSLDLPYLRAYAARDIRLALVQSPRVNVPPIIIILMSIRHLKAQVAGEFLLRLGRISSSPGHSENRKRIFTLLPVASQWFLRHGIPFHIGT
jgi:hypothetical protein